MWDHRAGSGKSEYFTKPRYIQFRQSAFRWRYPDIVIIVIVKWLYLLHFLCLSKKKKDTPWYKNVSTDTYFRFFFEILSDFCRYQVSVKTRQFNYFFKSRNWTETIYRQKSGKISKKNLKYVSVDLFLYQGVSFFLLLKHKKCQRYSHTDYNHYNHYIWISPSKGILPQLTNIFIYLLNK